MRTRILIFFITAIACAAAEMEATNGFEVRDLGPMGGQVLVPKGWFFATGQAPNGPFYTISREDSAQGSYDTGMRIQLLAKVKATAGITPKQAVQVNVERKKGMEEVVRECPESKMGMFWRVCLETLGFPSKAKPTQKFHLVYSFWWNDEADIMAAVTFGAPIEEWHEASKIYEAIKDFKLVDLDRVQKDNKPNRAPPTSGTVTPRAEPRVAPAPAVAHLYQNVEKSRSLNKILSIAGVSQSKLKFRSVVSAEISVPSVSPIPSFW